MSWQCVEAVLRSRLPSNLKLTLVALTSKANKDGSTMFRSIPELAADTSKRWRQVIRDLKWLEDHGIIAEVNGRRMHGPKGMHARIGGPGQCPRYRLNSDTLAAYQPSMMSEEKPCHPRQGFNHETLSSTAGFLPSETLSSVTETLSSMTETLSWVTPDPKETKDPKKEHRGCAAVPPPDEADKEARDREVAMSELARARAAVFGPQR